MIDFSLTVQKGESIGLVGESGCGKSTVAMAIMQYMGGNGTIKSGSIRFKGVELTELPPDELRNLPRLPHLDDLPGAVRRAQSEPHAGDPSSRKSR